MPAFSYTAINEAGIKKKGILSANSEREARRLVKDLQLTPLKITESKDITSDLISAEITCSYAYASRTLAANARHTMLLGPPSLCNEKLPRGV